MKPGDLCPHCGGPVMFAAGFHDDHRYVHSHRCITRNRTLVACVCGAWAWGSDTNDALAKIGGRRAP